MARLNVYLSDALHAELAPLAGRINVSAVLQDALRQEIKIMNTTTTDKLDRLRASKAKHLQREEQEGREAGVLWAVNDADYAHLESIAEAIAMAWIEIGVSDYGIAVDGRELSVLSSSDAWSRGFVAGAAEVFNELED